MKCTNGLAIEWRLDFRLHSDILGPYSLHACDTGHKGPYARCQELIKVQRYVTWKVVAL